MTRKPNPQPPRTVDASTSALDGAVVDVAETHLIHDHVLFPNVEPIPMEVTTSATVVLPARWRPLLCPECDGARRPGSADPLDLDHDERCDLGAADRAVVEHDLAVIRREVARGGRAQRSRLVSEPERALLAVYGVVAPSHFTTVHLDADGRWHRTWRWLDEPALRAG